MTLVMTSWNGSVMIGHYDGAGTCDRGNSRYEGWWGQSVDSYPFGELFNHLVAAKTCYVTQGFWNSLTEQEKTTCKQYGQGIVGSGYFEDYMKEYPWVCARFVPGSIIECFTDACRSLRPDLTCKGVICDPVCIGSDKYSQACITEGENAGECAFDQLIEPNSPDCPGYDPCLGVECPDKCVDYDLYSQICENGICIRGVLIKDDATECGFVPPEPEPDPDKISWDTIILVGVVIILFYFLVVRGSS